MIADIVLGRRQRHPERTKVSLQYDSPRNACEMERDERQHPLVR
jgi:hypothetical protein